MARKYIIVTLANHTNGELQDMINNSLITNLNSTTKNEDETKSVFKYEGTKPSCFGDLTVYTESQILTEMNKSEWDYI